MVHVIHEEKWKAKEIQEGENIMTTGTPEQRPSPQISHKLLTDPVIFLRKWVGEVRHYTALISIIKIPDSIGMLMNLLMNLFIFYRHDLCA